MVLLTEHHAVFYRLTGVAMFKFRFIVVDCRRLPFVEIKPFAAGGETLPYKIHHTAKPQFCIPVVYIAVGVRRLIILL